MRLKSAYLIFALILMLIGYFAILQSE